MNRDEYLEKALRALESARILLNHGDPEGAVNRAYYSAFDAAHYALLSENIEYDPAQTRTHKRRRTFKTPLRQSVSRVSSCPTSFHVLRQSMFCVCSIRHPHSRIRESTGQVIPKLLLHSRVAVD